MKTLFALIACAASVLAQQTVLPITAPAILDKGSGSTSVAAKTLTVTFPHTTPYGATLIAGCGGSQFAGSNWAVALTDSEGNSWTQSGSLQSNSTTQWAAMFQASNVIGGTADAVTVTISGSSASNQSIACQLWAMLGTYSPVTILDVSGGGFQASGTSLTASATATGMGEYAFSAVVSGNTGPPTITAGATNPWVLESTVTPASGSIVFGAQSLPLTGGSNAGLTLTVTAGATLSQSNAAALAFAVYRCPILEVHNNGTLTVSGTVTANYAKTLLQPTVTTGSIGTTAGIALSTNGARKSFIIQNTGTTVIKVILGNSPPTQTSYTVALKACSAADAGDGGAYIDSIWTGQVQVISSGASGAYVITEVI